MTRADENCVKTGCRRIRYVCEDCGRVTNKVDMTEAITNSVEDAVKEHTGNSLAANPNEWFCKPCRELKDEFIKQAIAQERERCALLSESLCPYKQNAMKCKTGCNMHQIAAVIREGK